MWQYPPLSTVSTESASSLYSTRQHLSLWPGSGHLLGHHQVISGPTWDILRVWQKPLLCFFSLWFVFPDNSAASGWTPQCIGQVNLISLVCKLTKKTKSFADLSLSFCQYPQSSQTSWSVFRDSETARSTHSQIVRIILELLNYCTGSRYVKWF